jgi:hypothetical protein
MRGKSASSTMGIQFPLLPKEGRDATRSRTGWFRWAQNHTTPPPSPAPLLDEEGKDAGQAGTFDDADTVSPPVKEGRAATPSRTGW